MNRIDAWQRDVPPNWTVRPLRSVAEYAVSNVDKIPSDDELPVRLCNYMDVYNNEAIHLGMEFMAGTATQAEIDKFHLLADDVVITKDSESWDDIAIPALVTETADDFVCGYHLAMIRPDPEKLDGAFLFRCLQSKTLRIQLELAANGITRFGIPKNAIGSMALPVPPTPIQRAIARFLDRETADIDALIAAKQRLLDLLAEKRSAIVTEAIMRGLNPSAPLRPSGIDWLGDIPAHWEALDLKWVVTSISSGVSVNATDQPVIGSEPGVLKTSAAIGGRFLPSENKAVWESEYERLACPVKAESIIVSRMNTPALVAESGYVDIDYPNLFLPDRLWQVELDKSRAVPRFIAQVLSSHVVRSSLSEMATGTSASMKNLSQEDLLNFLIPLPPLAEQHEIVHHIATETAKIDRLRAATEHSITLLKERRGALIAAAVTGQVDIPEAA
jgi:type I restriction enzyme S subunit